ncbi:acyl-CoA dehydrogenase family protein [Actinokineospora globicatena]|uniref:acyl-CoA dehydrogenase family protein n=1 Tax=Actinokineospora globicatena TaxID=103729 RepID=UPI0020A408E0|nr:acyl-CoA dehydrogenase family protein [Actinokineospora globicatena]MCP2305177.1 acyl-CoA dehydrogenase [Actinokineospora globicatena]GLW80649.1 putative acyl-CoA dehydrogenase [Actinokineospora globicatena]GLW87476.1 putative acyl-CoA dehydrogenase [Actinokineospora globicatena]
MDFAHPARVLDLLDRVATFVRDEVEPAEVDHRRAVEADPWAVPPVVEELKAKARAQGLWNLFLPSESDLSTVEYAPLAEAMGRSPLAPEVFNCNAPDTGNMEVLHLYGSQAQQDRWLKPLLDGLIRSAFCMTEPDVASSDATNMAATAIPDDDKIVLNGTKWFSTGLGHPNCSVVIFMGLTDPTAPRHAQHSMVLVPLDTPGVTIDRMLPVFGRHDEPYGHGQVTFTDVRLPLDSVIAGLGRGFEIAQGRLGPGRVHHCMRLIGLAERALELACVRATRRVAFGKPLADLGGNRERVATARIAIDQARLLVLHTAWKLDAHGLAATRSEISQIKVAVPAMALSVIDMAIQLHGAAGMTDDFPLAAAYAAARSLRLADGPDEVHQDVVARLELKKHRP